MLVYLCWSCNIHPMSRDSPFQQQGYWVTKIKPTARLVSTITVLSQHCHGIYINSPKSNSWESAEASNSNWETESSYANAYAYWYWYWLHNRLYNGLLYNCREMKSKKGNGIPIEWKPQNNNYGNHPLILHVRKTPDIIVMVRQVFYLIIMIQSGCI